jgi:uncharacterized protein
MEFEWDEAKAVDNLAKHAFSFARAIAIFSDPEHFIVEDQRYQYDEKRFTVYGFIQSRLYVVIFTFRGEAVRIISARKANKREINFHGNRSL